MHVRPRESENSDSSYQDSSDDDTPLSAFPSAPEVDRSSVNDASSRALLLDEGGYENALKGTKKRGTWARIPSKDTSGRKKECQNRDLDVSLGGSVARPSFERAVVERSGGLRKA